MFTHADEVLKFIKDEDVKFVDVRFCDLPGVMQHFNVPAVSVGEDFFTDGQMFDGSSIRGFQAIHESDMKLIPDLTTRLPRPVPGREDAEHQHGHRRPVHRRAVQPRPAPGGRQGRGLPEVDRHRGHRVLRARGRVLHLRRRALRDQAERRLLLHRLDRGAPGTPAGSRRAATSATRRRTRVATSRCRRSTTSPTCATRSSSSSTRSGLQVERSHHEVGTAGQAEINYRFDTLAKSADKVMLFKYVVKSVAHAHGKTATFMPKPLFGDNGSGMHCHQSLWKDGEPLFFDEAGYGGLSDMARWYIGGLLQARAVAAGVHQPDGELLPPPGAGLRGAGQPGLLGPQPLGLRAHPGDRVEPEGQADRVPRARPVVATRTSRSRRC